MTTPPQAQETATPSLPRSLFYRAKDYDPQLVKTAEFDGSQARVARYRAAAKADFHKLIDDIKTLSAAAHAADRQGNLAAHWDSIEAAVAELKTASAKISKSIDNAERRYLESTNPPNERPTPAQEAAARQATLNVLASEIRQAAAGTTPEPGN